MALIAASYLANFAASLMRVSQSCFETGSRLRRVVGLTTERVGRLEEEITRLEEALASAREELAEARSVIDEIERARAASLFSGRGILTLISDLRVQLPGLGLPRVILPAHPDYHPSARGGEDV